MCSTVDLSPGFAGAGLDPDTPPAHGPDTPAIEDQVERLREALTEATPDDFRPDTPAPDENPPQDDSG